MAGNTVWRKRQIERELHAEVYAPDRFIDVGVLLSVVVQDPDGEELIPGKPRLRVVRRHRLGGIVDTLAVPPRFVAPSRAPVRWFCSVEQEPIILHADSDPLGQLVYGSEGAGKTVALAMWVYCRWLELIGERREIGITAPTETRLSLVLNEMRLLYPADWYTYKTADGIFEMCDGSRLRMVSTHQQSAAQGSRIQGFNWSGCAGDEAQDQVDQHEDIESRGRAARHGRYKQLRTATAKDDPDWRTLRDKLDAARTDDGKPLWVRRTLLGRSSPFIAPSFWDAKKSTMSPREYARRVEARDVGPERATYPEWSRDQSLVTIPDLGWLDVTAEMLRASGPNLRALVGHDPGSLFDVSLILKAYRTPRMKTDCLWVVVDEITTEQSTTEAHILKLLDRLRGVYAMNLTDRQGRTGVQNPELEQALIRCDPAGNTDTRTHKSVYTQFTNHGLLIKSAVYNADGGHGRVPKDEGIDLVNRLLCDASGKRRLLVSRLASGAPAAPKLVAALESSERDAAGRAETERKNARDPSHWPAALRYALWQIERPKLAAVNGGRA